MTQTEAIRRIVAETVRSEIAELRGFVDRRLAELSAEVHGTMQLMDFSETSLTSQLRTIHDQVAGLLASPASSRNRGLELEAVVQATESAANRIMEAAEAIAVWLRDGARDPASIALATESVNAIFEACSFQDVTGQRIRRAIRDLQHVESILTDLTPAVAAAPPAAAADAPPSEDPPQTALSQDAVDALFG
ncbi:hypothetical protein [Rhodopila sp.]|jgi:chemotaxis protein CheZ|uniref:hypothetical protein n=1 Tax=Rhodopila sp. TaxID=2480087 RepID=UPI002C6E058B|nr:hypothetical protein [Rhodopila sp.]HVZ09208.1 hypothetical protein [Rhodopila sp.]